MIERVRANLLPRFGHLAYLVLVHVRVNAILEAGQNEECPTDRPASQDGQCIAVLGPECVVECKHHAPWRRRSLAVQRIQKIAEARWYIAGSYESRDVRLEPGLSRDVVV